MTKKIKLMVLSLIMATSAYSSPAKILFISFSMPNMLLEQVAHESARLNIPLVLNGLHKSSMRKTLGKIFELAQKEKGVSVQIDPVAFKKYGITRVPALIVDDGMGFDVIRGNIKISEMLKFIKAKGETNV